MVKKLVELNNKSRKGLYLYIKEKGKPARYYKYNGQRNEKKVLTEYYNERYLQKKKTKRVTHYKKSRLAKTRKKQQPKKTSTKKRIQKTIRKAKKIGEVTQLIKTGVHSVTMNNPHKATNYQQAKKRTEIITKATTDKSNIELLSQEQNFNKLKSRLEIAITGYNEQGDKTISANRYNTTLRQAINEIKKTMLTEQDTRKGFTDPVLENLISKGWKNGQTHKEDRTIALKITITIRKG